MTQTISGYLIDKREYEALVAVSKRLGAASINLGSADRQDMAGLLALVLTRVQSITVVLEHGLTETLPPAGEDDD